jgi:hypothetical protein
MSKCWKRGIRVSLRMALCALVVRSAWAETEPAAGAKDATPNSLSGTLFFARAEREQMNSARKGGVVAPSPENLNTPRSTSAINGFVRRSDGTTTVWVDEQMRENMEPMIAAQLQPTSVGAPFTLHRVSEAENVHKATIKQKRKAPELVASKRYRRAFANGKSTKVK